MPEVTGRRKTPLTSLIFAAVFVAVPLIVLAQGQRGGAQGGAATGARAAAPVDLTGTWVSLVTEDWIERMCPDCPRSGVRGGRGGPGAAPAAAVASPPAGERCRAYAAGGSMRVPGRVTISWADDNTLKIELDAGTQTRLLHFDTTAAPAGTPKTLQGYSVASWEGARGGGGGFGGGGGGGNRGGAPAPAAARWGSLKVVTTNMTGGYLLSSRNSYGENATLTEYFSRHSDFGTEYFTVTALIDDPSAGGGGGGRGGPYSMTSSTFKKEANASKFAPTPCDIVK
jgi:hypothetical protein